MASNNNAGGADPKSVQRLKGILSVTVLQAKDLPRADYIGENDNYVVVSLNETTPQSDKSFDESCLRTQVQPGQSPIWNEKLPFPVPDKLQTLYVTVMDDDLGTADDVVATGQYEFDPKSSLTTTWLNDVNIPLTDESGRPAGSLRMLLHFIPQTSTDYIGAKFNEAANGLKQSILQIAAKKLTNVASQQVMSYVGA